MLIGPLDISQAVCGTRSESFSLEVLVPFLFPLDFLPEPQQTCPKFLVTRQMDSRNCSGFVDSVQLSSFNSSCKDIDDCRTLSTLILGCVATLVAATWVSVHPNIPAPNIGHIMLALHRLKLMLLAIIAPEVIAIWALRQRMVAHRLSAGKEA
jgi:hypothetical protein